MRGHSEDMGLKKIVIRGARQHNLKNISLEFPRNTLTVITGLGFGQILARIRHALRRGPAALRRIAVGLRAAFLADGAPEVDSIEGLSPAIAIERRPPARSPAFDGGDHHRDLRLPARGVRGDWRPALPELRARDRAAIDRADHAVE